MKMSFQSKSVNRGRLIIPVSEFSFAAWPVRINHDFRCVPHALRPSIAPKKSQWRGLVQQISRWLRRPCGEATALP
jgi:hypothetical protein